MKMRGTGWVGVCGVVGAWLVTLETSCEVGPDYERPPLEVPAKYKSATEQESRSPVIDKDWWRLFGDQGLTELEEAATRSNQDLQAAMARVAQARAAARVARAQFFPAITANPFAQRSGTSANASTFGPFVGNAITANMFEAPLDFSYELDIWGRVRRSFESATALARASEDDAHVILHTVQADVAVNVFAIRSLDTQIEILTKTVQVYREQLSLFETQLRAGLIGPITIAQAQTQLYSTITQQVEARRVRADLEHALAILLGRPPAEFSLAAQSLKVVPPVIPAGLPAELLRRRPDVGEAEQDLAAANAQIGVAMAQFYPTIRLTGTAGFESADVLSLFDWASRIWSIGVNALAPIFLGGQLDANLDQAKARYLELVANYRGRVLSAFGDVEDALTDLHHKAEQAEAQEKAVSSAREYLRLSESLFKQGLVAYLQVTDAQRAVLANELLAVQILNDRLSATIRLIKALGAGWDAEAGETP